MVVMTQPCLVYNCGVNAMDVRGVSALIDLSGLTALSHCYSVIVLCECCGITTMCGSVTRNSSEWLLWSCRVVELTVDVVV